MVKLYFTSLFILFFSIGFSQSYPYLNASTANENEFPVDKDTNIYMFHGNRLVKTDKNFNTIWANTYSGITNFSRLLLSKTGSIYCVATASFSTVFGKVNPNGSVAWFKNASTISVNTGTSTISRQISSSKVFLDRNNHLIVSGETGYPGEAGFVKLDTNGNALKFKLFELTWYSEGFSILTDSSGYYKFVGVGYAGMGPGRDLGIYYYNDNTDVFTKAERIAGVGTPSCTGFGWKLITSKFNNRFYIQTTVCGVAGNYPGIVKLTMAGKPLWYGSFSNFHGISYIGWGHLEESNNGDLFYGLSTGNFLANYTSAFMKIDSNGVAGSSSARSILYNYPLGFVQPPNHASRRIHNGSYYVDVSGQYFPSNPLTIQKFNSSLTYACSSTVSVSYNSTSASSSFTIPANIPTITPVSSYTVFAYSASATAVPFTINPNFCLVLNENGLEAETNEISVYPNPAHDKLFITEKNYAVNSIEIFDLNGRNIKSAAKDSSIDISNLPNGIYFIRIKTDKGEINEKIVKE